MAEELGSFRLRPIKVTDQDLTQGPTEACERPCRAENLAHVWCSRYTDRLAWPDQARCKKLHLMSTCLQTSPTTDPVLLGMPGFVCAI